jgi:hypothetical protein
MHPQPEDIGRLNIAINGHCDLVVDGPKARNHGAGRRSEDIGARVVIPKVHPSHSCFYSLHGTVSPLVLRKAVGNEGEA